MIYDNGKELAWPQDLQKNEIYVTAVHDPKITIGELRNHANAFVSTDIICHFDSDDWSHPNRMSEQVALLQAAVRNARARVCCLVIGRLSNQSCQESESPRWYASTRHHPSMTASMREAWLYTNNDTRYALGTSLCYWKETWKRVPFFLHLPVKDSSGEDDRFVKSVDCLGYPALTAHSRQSTDGRCRA